MITVQLNWNEVEIAADAGKLRFIAPIRQGQNNRYGARNDWTNDIHSCLAELAVAKATNQYWHAAPAQYDGSNLLQERSKIKNDVGEDLEVRTSRTNKLIVRSGDKDERLYVLVSWPKWTKDGCVLSILGGMRAWEAKKDKYVETFGRDNRPPCFAVPPSDLVAPESFLNIDKT